MLTRITGRVDCFGCVCVPSRLEDKVLCVLHFMCKYVHVLYCVLFYWYLLCKFILLVIYKFILLVSFMQISVIHRQ